MYKTLFVFGLLSAAMGVSSSYAQTSENIDPAILHQAIVAGCEYKFNQDTSVPQGYGHNLCVCVDNWFKSNNINDAQTIIANKPMMPKIVLYCMQSLAQK